MLGSIGAAAVFAALVGLASWDGPDQRLVVGPATTADRTTTQPAGVPSTVAAGGPAGMTAVAGPAAEAQPPSSSSTAQGSQAAAGAGPDSGPAPAPVDVGARTSGVLGGLAQGGAPSGGRGGAPPETSTTTAPPQPSTGTTVTVAREDNGRTLDLVVGDTVVVRLEPVTGLGWTDPASSGPALIRMSVDRTRSGVTARFSAARTGDVEITATGAAPCTTASPPCLSPAEPYRVTVRITG